MQMLILSSTLEVQEGFKFGYAMRASRAVQYEQSVTRDWYTLRITDPENPAPDCTYILTPDDGLTLKAEGATS